MPFDPQPNSPALEIAVFAAPVFGELAPPPPRSAEPRRLPKPDWKDRPVHEWQDECRANAPYWQRRDPVPPQPETSPELESPGDTLSERQEAFCRAYVERPVAAKAARLAGYFAGLGREAGEQALEAPGHRAPYLSSCATSKEWSARCAATPSSIRPKRCSKLRLRFGEYLGIMAGPADV